MPHFSTSTIVLLIIAALLLFGPNRLPELGRAVGKTFREFKNGTKEMMEDSAAPDQTAVRKEVGAAEGAVSLEMKAQPAPGTTPES